jgi:N-acetylglucosamine kinase-like BadF-type ATPase
VTGTYRLDFDAIVRHIHTDLTDRQSVAGLARVVMALDDPVMLEIVDAGTDFLITMARALRRELGDDLPVAMHGGMFQDRRIRSRFVAVTAAIEPAQAPEFGAVSLALNELERRNPWRVEEEHR